MREPLPSEAAWEERLGCSERSSCFLHNQVNWSQTLKTKACDPFKGCCPFLRFSIVSPATHAFVLSRFSCVSLFVTLWTIAYQAPLSMGFPRQEFWSGLPCSPPGDLPNLGIEPGTPALQVDSLSLSRGGSPWPTTVPPILTHVYTLVFFFCMHVLAFCLFVCLDIRMFIEMWPWQYFF